MKPFCRLLPFPHARNTVSQYADPQVNESSEEREQSSPRHPPSNRQSKIKQIAYRIFFLLLLAVSAHAQTAPDCDDMLRQAKNFEKNNELSKAVQFYLNALNCNTALSGEIGPRLKEVFAKIEEQRAREIIERKRAQTALESLRKGQIDKLMADAIAFRKDRRFTDALRTCTEANALAKTIAERDAIERQRAKILQEKDEFEFERNRNIALALKAANDCRAALPYFAKALKVRPGDEALKAAQSGCER